MASLSIARDAVGVCLLGDRLYAVGGYDGQSYLSTVESYDAQNNEWTEVTLHPFCPTRKAELAELAEAISFSFCQ